MNDFWSLCSCEKAVVSKRELFVFCAIIQGLSTKLINQSLAQNKLLNNSTQSLTLFQDSSLNQSRTNGLNKFIPNSSNIQQSKFEKFDKGSF